MIGFILAAGFGTRLKPITDTVPKALVPVCGEPLLTYNLRTLDNAGLFSAIGVNSHYLHEQLVKYQKKSQIKFTLFHEEEKIYGTGGALYFAREFLSRDGSFMVANVDILHNFDLVELAARFIDSENICSLVSIPTSDKGTILYDKSNLKFLGVSAERDNISNNINNNIDNKNIAEADFTGITFYRKEFLNYVNADDFSIIPIWKRAAENGETLGIISPTENTWWADIGTHEALKKVEADMKNGTVVL